MSPPSVNLTVQASPSHCTASTHFQVASLTSWILSVYAVNTNSSQHLAESSCSDFNPFALLLKLLHASSHSLLLPNLVFLRPPLGSCSLHLPSWEFVLGPRAPLLAFSGIHQAVVCQCVSLLELWGLMEFFMVQMGVNRDLDTGGTVNNVDSQFVSHPTPRCFDFRQAGGDGMGE